MKEEIVEKETVCSWVEKKENYILKVGEGAEIFWQSDKIP